MQIGGELKPRRDLLTLSISYHAHRLETHADISNKGNGESGTNGRTIFFQPPSVYHRYVGYSQQVPPCPHTQKHVWAPPFTIFIQTYNYFSFFMDDCSPLEIHGNCVQGKQEEVWAWTMASDTQTLIKPNQKLHVLPSPHSTQHPPVLQDAWRSPLACDLKEPHTEQVRVGFCLSKQGDDCSFATRTARVFRIKQCPVLFHLQNIYGTFLHGWER